MAQKLQKKILLAVPGAKIILFYLNLSLKNIRIVFVYFLCTITKYSSSNFVFLLFFYFIFLT